MSTENRIDIGTLKTLVRATAAEGALDQMTDQLVQLIVATLDIKGATIFALNPNSDELEILSSFGLSVDYLNKGPVMINESIGPQLRQQPVIISDISKSSQLQYPQEAKDEGIVAIISVPIRLFYTFVGVLRLYHSEAWDMSAEDLDSLLVIAENAGLAMMYTRMRRALRETRESIGNVHEIWTT